MNSVLILLVIIYGLSLIGSFLVITLALPIEQRQEELTLLIAIQGVLIAAALGFYFGKKPNPSPWFMLNKLLCVSFAIVTRTTIFLIRNSFLGKMVKNVKCSL
ncbi:hypothetical protein PCC7418_0350 [Halothece sp. PCC 7418]|uniref:hypothetical protein n=1 Tax=Halothece sp. (strain PCC 7418) TaxID=65093 RepID=UPI0002A06EFA|nr:hypothetical protein [Halothece sp. PCC 7418]AFZ42584.1 hypothetical protein PCC7418_0350 [Halothece sp. PCC 7418]